MTQFHTQSSMPGIFRKSIRWMVMLFALFSFGGTVSAQYNVTSTTDFAYTAINNSTGVITAGAGVGQVSLRSALQGADATGGTQTVTVPAGTYNLVRGEMTIGNIAQNITINGAGAATTIVHMTSTLQDRILMINPPGTVAGVITSINGISFTGGRLTSDIYGGGAILAGGPTNQLTINNCIFDDNSFGAGGGTTGGAINMSGGGALNITNTTFSNNVNNVSDGGAVYYFFQNFSGLTGSVSISGCTFTNNNANTAGATGGAIGIAAQGQIAPFNQTLTVSITKNTFTGNNANANGGAISINNGAAAYTMTVNYNRITGNTAGSATTTGLSMASAAGSANANDNWWGSNIGPSVAGAGDNAAVVGSGGGGTLTLATWLQLKLSAAPSTLCATTSPTSALVTASFLTNSSNVAVPVANLSTLIGLPITYSAVLGTLSGAQPTIQATGTSTVTFTSNGTAGAASVNGVVDVVPNNDPTAKASITVNILPSITVQPVNATTCAGSTTTFSVTATGTPAPTYQWRKGTTNLTNGATGNGSTIAGATTNTLTITGTALADATSDYNVVVTNSCGTATSSNVSLTVKALPVVTAPTVTQPTCTTPTGTIVVNATGASGTLEYSINNGGSYQASATFSGLAPGSSNNIVVRYTTAPNCPVSYASNPVVISAVPLPPTVNNPATATGTVNAAFSQTFTTTGGLAPMSFATTSTLPAGLSLSTAGVLSGTPTQTGTFPIVVKATDANGCVGTGATYNLVINCQTITVTNPATTTGTVNAAFSQTFTQTGGFGTTNFTTASTLPAGLTLSTAGVLSGTPTQSGTFPIVVKATDANGCFGNGATYTLVIGCQTITVTNPAVTSGGLSVPFSQTFTQTGAVGGTTFTLNSGTLPTGLTLSTAGVLSGTPTQTGSFPITVKVTDANGCTGVGPTYNLSIAVSPCTVNQVTLIGTPASIFHNNTITGFTVPGGTNRMLVVTASDANSTTITGVTFNGTPMTQATFKSDGTAVDAIYYLAMGSSLTPVTGNVVVTSGSTDQFITAQVFESVDQANPISASNSAANNTTPSASTLTVAGATNDLGFDLFDYFRSATSANSASFGGGQTAIINQGPLTITGGSGGFGYWSTSRKNSAASLSMSRTTSDGNALIHIVVNIKSAPATVITVTNPAVTTGQQNVAFSQTFTASGGAAPYVFTTSSSLPAGLSLSSGGVLSGTPTVTGTFPIVVKATDANGCFANGSTYNLVISACPTITVTNPATTTGTAGTAFNQTFTAAGGATPYTFTTASTLPAGLTLSAAGVLSGTPTQTGTFPIVVTATDNNTCTGTGSTYNLVISCPAPVTGTATPSSQTICSGSAVTTIVLAGAPAGATYNWTRDNTATATGIAASGSGDISGTLNNTGTAPVTVTFTITPVYYGSCSGTPYTATVTVNPVPVVTQMTPQTLCAGSSSAPVNFSSTATGGTIVYNWTGTTGAIGLPTIGSGNIASFTAVNTGSTVLTDTIKVVASYTNGVTCTGPTMLFVITVNPTATVNTVADQTVCNGSSTTAVNFTGPVAGTVYSWTNNNTSTGLAASGVGNIASFTGTNATNAPITSTVTVTPTFYNQSIMGSLVPGDLSMPNRLFRDGVGASCPSKAFPGTSGGAHLYDTYSFVNTTGQAQCVTITYNAKSTGDVFVSAYNGSFNPAALSTNYLGDGGSSSIGGSVSTFSVNVASGATLVLVANEANSAPCPVYVISVSGIGLACTGTPSTFNITVNPTPTVNAVSNQTVCNGAPTAAVTFSGAVAGTVYNWANSDPTIGLAASGSGNIASFNGINTGTAPVTATITVTPSYTNGGTTCTGTPTTFTITVNPTPAVNAVGNQTVCNGAPTTAVTFSGAVAGTVYNWTNNTTSIGLAASGSGNIASFIATNAGTAPVTATITVTPSYTNGGTTCTGTPTTFTITVNPTATVTAVPNQVVCNGAPTTAVTFSSPTTGGTIVYNWTNNTPSIGLAASGSGNIASFTATNAGTAPVTATITVTPSYTNGAVTCTGTPRTFTITVNPTATVTAVPNQVVCNGAPTTSVTFSSPTTGGTIVYNWTNNTPSIGLAASGSGNIASFTATNAGTAPVTATITVTPSYTNGAVTCTGTPTTFTITVNPTATVNAIANQVVCNGAPTTAVTFSSPTTGGTIVYNWTNNTPSIGLAASGSGNIASFTATNATNVPVTATITVTPSYTNGAVTCTGTPRTFTITVNPTPTVNTPANQTVCNGAPTTAVYFSGNQSGSVCGTVAENGTLTLTAPFGAVFTAVKFASYGTPTGSCGSFALGGCNAANSVSVISAAFLGQNSASIVASNATFGDPCFGTGKSLYVELIYTLPGAVYNWTNSNTSIGLAASGSGNIASFNGTNATNAPVTAAITVTPSYTNGAVTCTGTPATFNITVNPTATINAVANQVICNGAPTTAVNFSSPTTGGTIVYNWTNNNTSIGLAASGSGNIASFTATNATTAPVTATITVTPSYTNNAVTCTGTPITFTITVNPTATVNPVANQTVCNGAPTAAVNFSSPTSGGTIVYNWTNNTPSIGLAASGSGNIASFNGTNAGTAPVTATITVTPSYTNGAVTCTGTPITFTITVNPTATVNAVANQVVCNGSPTTAVTFSSPTTGGTIVYNWTNSAPSIGLAANGSGNIASFTATNTGTAPVTATITVTPSYTNNAVTCVGTPRTFTITVNPTATVNTVANQVVCNGAPTTAVTFSSPTTGGTIVYNWTNNTPSIGLAASGSGNIASFNGTNATNAPVTATITVTPSYTNGAVTCTGTPITFTITVNPTATVNAIANQVVCNNANTTAVNFSSPTTGGTIVYNWTNNTTSIGLAASGSGNIASFVATNTTNAPVTATITVTPSYTNGSVTCVGTPRTFTITVNPTAIINPVANQVLCNTSNTTAVNFSSPTTGGTIVYNWTNSAPSIGLAASGSGNIASFVATNTTFAPIVATITVTPAYTNGAVTCNGTPITFTITVNPTPNVDPVANETVCNGSPTTAVTFTGNVAGTVYNWTNTNTTIGLAASGTGDIASFNTINNGTAPVTATITVTPSYTNAGVTCTGSPISYVITVNPTPIITPVANQTVCNNANTTAVNFSSTATGGTIAYNWSNNMPSIGLASSGTGNIPSFVAINNGTAPITASVNVIPFYTNNGVTCSGPSITFTITVNPTPSVNTVANQAVCNGTGSTAVVFTGSVPGTVYNWTNSNTAIGLGASGSGNIPSFTGTNAGTAPISGTITVTPSYTNGSATCTGAPITFTITINPTPTVNAISNQTVCNNGNTTAITFSGAVPGTVYNWTNSNTAIGLAASGSGNIASFVATNSTNAPITATITVTPTFTNAGTTCAGTPRTFTITVNPTPTVNTVANQVVCNGSSTSVTFSGFVPGTVYSWTNNTTSIGLAASGTGNIPAFTAVNAGTAPVVATITVTPSYTNGSVTCTGTPTTFTITVNPTTVIGTQPVNAIVCAGNTATFSVTATGANLTYQWQVNTGSGFNNIPGAVNATYTTNATTPSMNGYIYHVIVTGACGTLTSSNVTLTVNTAPAITVQPVNTLGCIAGSATFSVTATGTALTYQWQVNTGSGFNNIAGATASTYTQTGITAAMNGWQYQVIVSGACTPPVTSNIAALSVGVTTVINTQPASLTICFGQNAVLTVGATGTGLTYQWQVNSGSGFTNIPGATSATYTITAPPLSVSGNTYRVIVTGSCGTVTSNNAVVVIFALPNISFNLQQQKICLSDTVTTLRALPAGGTWSGPGVIGTDKFDPRKAGIGITTLTYTVTNLNGCISTRDMNVMVYDCVERHNNLFATIKVAPNPNHGNFDILVLSDIITEADFQIVSGKGQVMKQWHQGNLIYGTRIPINLTTVASGTYYLKVRSGADHAEFPILILP